MKIDDLMIKIFTRSVTDRSPGLVYEVDVLGKEFKKSLAPEGRLNFAIGRNVNYTNMQKIRFLQKIMRL